MGLRDRDTVPTFKGPDIVTSALAVGNATGAHQPAFHPPVIWKQREGKSPSALTDEQLPAEKTLQAEEGKCEMQSTGSSTAQCLHNAMRASKAQDPARVAVHRAGDKSTVGGMSGARTPL